MSKSIIEIKRVSQWANKIRGIAVFANGQKLGKIGDGETKQFEVSSGDIDLYTQIDWCRTKPIQFRANPGETYRFELGSNLEGHKLFYMSAYYVLFKPSEYLYLKDVDLVQ